MAAKPNRSTFFILLLLGLMAGGVMFLMFADVPIQQTEKTMQVKHEAFNN